MKHYTAQAVNTLRVIASLAVCAAIVSCHTPPRFNLPVGADLPPFYDAGNIAEYYGRCPRCNSWVKGYMTFWDGVDSDGKFFGGSGICGRCEVCQINLLAEDPPFTDTLRVVVWHLGTKTTSSSLAPKGTDDQEQENYVVQKGDTIAKVARDHGVSVEDIVTMNILTNPDIIRIGQKLKLPRMHSSNTTEQ